MSPKSVRRATEICNTCPVFTECLTWALEHDEKYGVWAGTSGRVRRRIQQMMEQGFVTVEQVVKDYENGNKEDYEGTQEKRAIDSELRDNKSLRDARNGKKPRLYP